MEEKPFDISNHGYFKIPLPFTDRFVIFNDSIFAMLAVGAVLIILALIIRIKMRKWKDVPESGFQNAVELVIEIFRNFAASTLGEKYVGFGCWFFGLFAYIAVSNWSGILGLRPPTADLAQTLAFALVTWVLVQITGITQMKKGYFKEFITPNPVFLPIHLIGEVTPLVSLSFRMFGNILGGFIIMELIYDMFPKFVLFIVPAPLHIYFDLFVGSLQAFIFVVLSMTFIKNKTHAHGE